VARQSADWSLLLKGHPPLFVFVPLMQGGIHRVGIENTSTRHWRKFFKAQGPGCMLQHFKKGFSGDYGIKMSPRKLHMLCELEWPTFGVNWPPKGTLELPTARASDSKISSPISTSGFRWLKPCSLGSDSVSTKRDGAEFLWPSNEAQGSEADQACSARGSRR
jgi:hypothetical protein